MSGTGKDNSVIGQIANTTNQFVRAISSYDPGKGKFTNKGDSVFKSVSQIDGYNPDTGQWGGKGSDVDWLNEGVGQINGSNAARHAAGVAGDAVNLAKEQADELVQQKNIQQAQSDLQASNQAAGARATAKASGVFNPSMATALAMGPAATAPKLGSDQRDYLGL